LQSNLQHRRRRRGRQAAHGSDQRAHARGLLVHTWTFRDDAFPTGYPGGPVEEYLAFYRLGIDGVFSDFPDTAFDAREIFRDF